MPVHNARYVTGPRNPGGVDSMRPEPKCGAQAGDPNDDPSAHDDLILAKFTGSRDGRFVSCERPDSVLAHVHQFVYSVAR